MLLNLSNKLVDAAGKNLENGKSLGDALSESLCSFPTDLFSNLKSWGWAKDLSQKGEIEVDLNDLNLLEKFVEKSNLFPMVKGQLLEAILELKDRNRK